MPPLISKSHQSLEAQVAWTNLEHSKANLYINLKTKDSIMRSLEGALNETRHPGTQALVLPPPLYNLKPDLSSLLWASLRSVCKRVTSHGHQGAALSLSLFPNSSLLGRRSDQFLKIKRRCVFPQWWKIGFQKYVILVERMSSKPSPLDQASG